MPKITKRTVDALAPAEKERVVWDDDIKGFGVRVHPTGRKVYIVKYRHEGRSVKVTIGPHGPVTPAAARARAAEIVTLAKTGRDVAGKTLRNGGGATVVDLAQRFMQEYAPAHLRPSTARLYRKIIDNRILPRLGKRRVGDIGKNDVCQRRRDYVPARRSKNVPRASAVACPRSPREGPARGATRPPRGWRRPARGRGLWAHGVKRGYSDGRWRCDRLCLSL